MPSDAADTAQKPRRNTMKTNEERRHFQRITFHSHVMLEKDGLQLLAELLDISLKGLLVTPPQGTALKIGTRLRATIPLTGSRDTIAMECKVTHLEKKRVGLEWREIDADDFAKLRQVLLLNTGSDALVQRELAAMIEANSE